MFKLAISIMLCQCAGIIGAFLTHQSIPTWYEHISKPSFTPPDWVFGPVWTVLYTLMGIAAYLVWRKGLLTAGVKTALAIFILQLTLNGLWSVAFFGGRSIAGGMIVIALLWLAIAWTIVAFFNLSKPAVILLIPYILWVSFALVLNAALVILN